MHGQFQDERLDRKEAAKYLKVTVGTLANWACKGCHGLPYHKIGSRVIYLKSDLDAFLRAGRMER